MDTAERGPHAYHGFIIGRVQGVAFRWSTVEVATRLGLCGWIRNCRDGRVEVWAEGSSASLEALVEWLRHGPARARVTRTEIYETSAQGFEGFSVNPDN